MAALELSFCNTSNSSWALKKEKHSKIFIWHTTSLPNCHFICSTPCLKTHFYRKTSPAEEENKIKNYIIVCCSPYRKSCGFEHLPLCWQSCIFIPGLWWEGDFLSKVKMTGPQSLTHQKTVWRGHHLSIYGHMDYTGLRG